MNKLVGQKMDRCELDNALISLREDDTLVVTKLDQLEWTLKGFVDVIEEFKQRDVHFKCLDDRLDRNSTTG